MKIIKPIVTKALAQNPKARADDRWLFVEVLKLEGIPISEELEATVERWPMPESVRRARTRIQNEEHRLLPSAEVVSRRQRHAGAKPRRSDG